MPRRQPMTFPQTLILPYPRGSREGINPETLHNHTAGDQAEIVAFSGLGVFIWSPYPSFFNPTSSLTSPSYCLHLYAPFTNHDPEKNRLFRL